MSFNGIVKPKNTRYFPNSINMQWIWVGINLDCIDAYAVQEWTNEMKLHVFATKHKANT